MKELKRLKHTKVQFYPLFYVGLKPNLAVGEENRLKARENEWLSRKSGHKREKLTKEYREYIVTSHIPRIHILYE
jgi:hypothetical protein